MYNTSILLYFDPPVFDTRPKSNNWKSRFYPEINVLQKREYNALISGKKKLSSISKVNIPFSELFPLSFEQLNKMYSNKRNVSYEYETTI